MACVCNVYINQTELEKPASIKQRKQAYEFEDVGWGVVAVCQVPQYAEHLRGHDAIGVILGQPSDKLKQIRDDLRRNQLTMLDRRMLKSMTDLLGSTPAALEALEQVLELLRVECPGQFGQQLLDVAVNEHA